MHKPFTSNYKLKSLAFQLKLTYSNTQLVFTRLNIYSVQPLFIMVGEDEFKIIINIRRRSILMRPVFKRMKTSFADFVKNDTTILKLPREGEVVEGKLIEKKPRRAYFDLGSLGTGIVYGREYINAKETIKGLEAGDKINAKISGVQNEDGYIELSLGAASEEKQWGGVQELKETGEVITIKITGANSGGLIADISNLKAFLPVSQLSNEHYPRVSSSENQKEAILKELKKFTGQEMRVKVIDVNPRNEKLIISEREITDENVKELLKKYTVGDIIDGIVSGVADFGAFVKFVDNPAIEGLIHISELDHKLIEGPKDVVKVDDAVRVKIIDIKDGRVFLSLKALKTDPWATVAEKYKEGTEVKGKVKKFNPYGAFIDLGDGEIQGLIHVSEFGGTEEMKKVLEIGNSYTFIISMVRPEEKRLLLKLKK